MVAAAAVSGGDRCCPADPGLLYSSSRYDVSVRCFVNSAGTQQEPTSFYLADEPTFLRSATSSLLTVSRTRLSTPGDPAATLRIWNILPSQNTPKTYFSTQCSVAMKCPCGAILDASHFSRSFSFVLLINSRIASKAEHNLIS